ncbi:pyridoxal kinase [Rhodobacteraceae bacterium]|nr:pyridoxal kinase [Paracoccaceae bacterium]
MPPFVISIQSQVVYGHVGNSAALFPMQAAGLEVAMIPTVVFSNTPDYPTLRGRALPDDFFADLLLGATERALARKAQFIMSGYIGSVGVARQTARFIAQAKAENPDLVYLCDPVLGDTKPGLYVPAEIARVMQDELLPLADIATPNPFELEWLTGHTITSMADLARAYRDLGLGHGAQLIATGCSLSDTPAGQIESVVMTPDTTTRHPTPHLPMAKAGTGDLFAALVITALAHARPLAKAVDFAQTLTGRALAHAEHLGRDEVVLSEPGFRAQLLALGRDTAQ